MTVLHGACAIAFTMALPLILAYNTTYIISMMDVYCPGTDICDLAYTDNTTHQESSPCLKCSCDEHCSLKGNCCPSAEENQTPVLPGYSTRDQKFGCILPHQSIEHQNTEIRQHIGVLMVTSCLNGQVDERCTKPNDTILLENLPQTSIESGISYRNVYCGICNNETSFIPWKPYVTCSNINVMRADSFLFPNSVENTYKYAATSRDSTCGVEFHPPAETGISNDLCFDNVLNRTCEANDSLLSNACEDLTIPFVYKQGNLTEVYANIFCFLCQTNSEITNNEMQETLQLINADNTFIAQLNQENIQKHDTADLLLEVDGLIKQYSRRPTACEQDNLYDPYTEECRPWYCPTGSAIVDGVCVPVILEVVKATYQLRLNVVPENDTIDAFESCDKYNMTLDLLAAIFENEDRIEISLILLAEHWYDSFLYISALIKVVSPIADTVAGEFGRERFEKNYILLVSPDEVVSLNVSLSIGAKPEFTPMTSADIVVIDLKTYSAMKILYMSNLTDVKTLYKYPVLDKLAFCIQIALEKWEFLDFNDIIDIRVSDVRLYIGEHRRTPDDRKLRVCFTDYMSRAAEKLPYKDKPKYYSPQAIVSVVCNLMSITGLSITVLTYFIFGELRSIPGKNNMMLAIHLLIAQCLYQFGIEQTAFPKLCIAFGVFIHLFWLTSILWMNACTLHMFRTFVTGQSYRSYRALDPQVCMYVLYCYSISIIVITINIGVSMYRSDGESVGYGGNVCYISTPEMVGWTFALPVGIIIILNMGFFFAVVYQISASTMRRRGKSNDRANTIIYMKLSTLTGVTWIFGYLYLWTDFVPLEYVFIVLNAGQGVLIFFSFICTSRIIRLYNDLFRKIGRSIRHGSCWLSDEKAPDRSIKAIEMNVAKHAHSKSNSSSRTQDTAVATSPNGNTLPMPLPGGSVLIKSTENGMIIVADGQSEYSKHA